MHTGQMLTVLGAIMLLSLVGLSVNSMLIGKTTTMLEAEAQLNGISMAQSMLDEIMVKSFDAGTVSAKIFNAVDFTAAGALGCSPAENLFVPKPDVWPYNSVQGYNDIDDYHNYTRRVFNPRLGNFQLTDSVFYVLETDPDAKSSGQTFYKKITVTVRHPNMSKPLVISDVAVYRRYF